MSKNKLYTLGYFRQRLKLAGLWSKILIDKFSADDKRYWAISIDKDLQIFCICYKTHNDYYFEFIDGHQRCTMNIKIRTESMDVILEFLKDCKKKEISL